MELALYEPNVGYYTKSTAGPGPEGDFLTSPEMHAAFGGLLSAQLAEMWNALGRPSPFWLVEGGPGSGIFAADVLGAAAALFPDFAAGLRMALVEASPVMRARQATRLAPWAERVRWLDPTFEAAEPVGVGCMFANELLDALPVHRVVMGRDELFELYVSVRDGGFVEIEGPLSTPEIARQIDEGGGRLVPGQVAEVNLAAPTWVRSALRLIDRGYMLLLDYGEPADVLYGTEHPRGTLRCYWRHTTNEDPFVRVGLQDITAHVDLSAIARAAIGEGAQFLGATDQASLLGRLGLPFIDETVTRAGLPRPEEWAHRSALAALADPAGLGRIRALLFGKGAQRSDFSGFAQSEANSEWGARIGTWILESAPRLPHGATALGSAQLGAPTRDAGGRTRPRA